MSTPPAISVTKIMTPPMRKEGGGAITIRDCLAGVPLAELDPFLMLHELGPMPMRDVGALGMHPHRGFCEVPYVKQGWASMMDHWYQASLRPPGAAACGECRDSRPVPFGTRRCRRGETSDLDEGMLQWGHVGSGASQHDRRVARPSALFAGERDKGHAGVGEPRGRGCGRGSLTMGALSQASNTGRA